VVVWDTGKVVVKVKGKTDNGILIMPFRNLSKIERELYLKEKINQLGLMYEKVQHELEKKLRNMDITAFEKWRTEALLRETNLIVKQLNNGTKKWVEKNIPFGYWRGVDIAGERLKILGVTDTINYDATIHTSGINTLADEVTLDLLTANSSIRRTVNRYVRATQQSILEDKLISQMIAEGVISGEARRTISDKILIELRKQMGNEQFLTINGRHYQPKHYARLVARTRMREATTRGTINTCLQYRNDLVQWSVHAGACEICQTFMGRVYSLSGNDKEFPMLDERPSVHPNCECILVPITRPFLQRRLGTDYKNIVDLSQSKIPVETFAGYEQILHGVA